MENGHQRLKVRQSHPKEKTIDIALVHAGEAAFRDWIAALQDGLRGALGRP